MPKISKFIKASAMVSVAAAAVSVLAGCTSIEYGPYEKIAITSSPERALCKIYREGHGYVKAVATPGETYLMRDIAPINVVCSKQGYETASVVVATKRDNKDNIINFANFGIGFVIDTANGMYEELPETVHVDLPLRN